MREELSRQKYSDHGVPVDHARGHIGHKVLQPSSHTFYSHYSGELPHSVYKVVRSSGVLDWPDDSDYLGCDSVFLKPEIANIF